MEIIFYYRMCTEIQVKQFDKRKIKIKYTFGKYDAQILLAKRSTNSQKKHMFDHWRVEIYCIAKENSL